MKYTFLIVLLLAFQKTNSQVVLNADGPGNTYDLITSVLAPGYNPIEVPDCNHDAFGEHIDEVYDSDLGDNVFRFHIHTTPDNDRCIKFDRQRNEIKSYDKSSDNLLGVEDETVVYKWKFKLAAGFQSSPNFTHIHQLKSVGGSLESMPMYTLTTRKSSPDRLELRYAETDTQITLIQTPLAPFIGIWAEVTETIKYGTSGTYDIQIVKISDGSTLFSYTNNSIINWRPGADFVRPKWGIYRSLLNAQDLRDETILFANFSIEELEPLSVGQDEIETPIRYITSNPVENTLSLINLSNNVKSIQLYGLDGRLIKQVRTHTPEKNIDVSALSNGTYVLKLIGDQFSKSQLVIISN